MFPKFLMSEASCFVLARRVSYTDAADAQTFSFIAWVGLLSCHKTVCFMQK